ncbi:MAG: ectonucleotide pyrophosphatase/phosphodiesterase [Rhodothermales bacterium]
MRFALTLLAALCFAGCAPSPATAPSVPTSPVGGATAPERLAFPEGSGGTNAPAHRDAPTVVLVSFDGFRHDYLDRYPTPNFDRVAEAGVRADALVPSFPTLTFPNHYSIATGMYPDRHGLVGNTIYDPGFDATYSMRDRDAVGDGRWYGGEPIWVTAETQGLVTASYFWVGTEAPVMGVRPTTWKPYDNDVTYEARVDSALAWLSLPDARRPRLLTLYFSAVDGAGHRHGPDSPEVADAVARVDSALGRLLDGIERIDGRDDVNVVLVSDHGMAQPDAGQAVVVTDYVTLPDDVQALTAGPELMLWLDEAAADSLDVLLDVALPPTVRSYTRDELPEGWHFGTSPRTPPLILVAERPVLVGLPRHFERPWGGVHGYAPEDSTMGGIFLAAGPQVAAAGRIAAFDNVHIYPFLTALLGLRPNPDIDGDATVLAPALR